MDIPTNDIEDTAGDRPSTARRGEGGFSLIELLIVMVVLAIIMAIAVPSFLSAKKNAARSEIVGAAQSLAGAVEAFKLDHAGRVPQLGNADDWPGATPQELSRGPLNSMPGIKGTPKANYLRTKLPERVTSGVVPINATGGGDQGSIKYTTSGGTPGAPTAYTIEVFSGDESCTLGAAVDGIKACGS